MSLYPFKLQPSLHVKVWGGRNLETHFNKVLPTPEPYGEAWEVHDTAVVVNGSHAGKTLGDLLADYGAALIGAVSDPADGFPLLAKILDARDWLSVQVHPNDEQAAALEGQPRGKTEAWYVLHADPGAKLVIGVQPGTSPAAMAQAIRDGVLEELVSYADVQAGDALYLDANTVHALGPGIVIYEIQQSSDTTYRLYDWNRMDLSGQPRPLHIEKGVSVSNTAYLPTIAHPATEDAPSVTVFAGPYFTTELHTLTDSTGGLTTGGNRFHALTCIDGAIVLSAANTTFALGKGESALVPASVGAYTLSGTGKVLRSWQP